MGIALREERCKCRAISTWNFCSKRHFLSVVNFCAWRYIYLYMFSQEQMSIAHIKADVEPAFVKKV